MKLFTSKTPPFFRRIGSQRNFGYFLRLLHTLLFLVTIYSVLFYYIMRYEGFEYSVVTCVYWTLTVMSTLGFGDITFVSDIGRFFSIVVLLSGVTVLMVLLPLTFTQYVAWLDTQKEKKAPRVLDSSIHNHIIIVGLTPISLNLTQQFTKLGFYCVLLCPDVQTSIDLESQGFHVIIGNYDEKTTYENLGIRQAAALLAFDTDVRNSNIIFSAREANTSIPIIARAERDTSMDVLALAGSSHVFSFRQLLGTALASRITGNMGYFTYLTGIESLVITEASIEDTHLAGKTLRECALRAKLGVNVVGIWEKGTFTIPNPDDVLPKNASLVIAGTHEQFKAFDLMMTKTYSPKDGHVIVLGAGRVGVATAMNLDKQGIKVIIIDKIEPCITLPETIHTIRGDALDIDVLEKANIHTANAVIITTNDDDTNIYLTLYYRKLRPNIQIITRATLDRNVNILHSAGAHTVLSLVSMMINTVVNILAPGKIFMLNEGLSIFRCDVSEPLIGKSLLESDIRSKTSSNVVAILDQNGKIVVNPDPKHIFSKSEQLYIIGDNAGKTKLAQTYDINIFEE